MDPISVAPILALGSTTAANQVVPWLERHVGECVAAAACTILQALDEHQNGGLTPRTRGAGGDRIFDLYRLRCLMVSTWDWETIARHRGIEALRTISNGEISLSACDALVDHVLAIVSAVTRAECH